MVLTGAAGAAEYDAYGNSVWLGVMAVLAAAPDGGMLKCLDGNGAANAAERCGVDPTNRVQAARSPPHRDRYLPARRAICSARIFPTYNLLI